MEDFIAWVLLSCMFFLAIWYGVRTVYYIAMLIFWDIESWFRD